MPGITEKYAHLLNMGENTARCTAVLSVAFLGLQSEPAPQPFQAVLPNQSWSAHKGNMKKKKRRNAGGCNLLWTDYESVDGLTNLNEPNLNFVLWRLLAAQKELIFCPVLQENSIFLFISRDLLSTSYYVI